MRLAVVLIAVMLVFISGRIPTSSLRYGLVFYMPIDEGVGVSTFDITRNNTVNPFTIGGGTWQLNKRVLFGGTNNAKITLTKSTALNLETSPITISFWCNRTGTGNRYIVCDLNAAANMYGPVGVVAVSSNKFFFGWSNITVVTGLTNEVSGQWVHVVAVRQGTTGAWTGKLFYNGRLDNSAATATNPSSQAANGTPSIATPGNYTGGTTLHYNGYVRDVMIWNRALTSEEIKELYIKQR